MVVIIILICLTLIIFAWSLAAGASILDRAEEEWCKNNNLSAEDR